MEKATIDTRPLAVRVRPQKLEDFYGLEDLYQRYPFLKVMVEQHFYRSSIFYGPSGSGKTTFALLLVHEANVPVFQINAVTSKKSDITDAIEASNKGPVILMIDEIHRLNKDKQEILLPVIESGAVVLFGLTTVHPYSSLPASIRSRVQLYHFEENTEETIVDALKRALKIDDILKNFNKEITDDALEQIARSASGDIRFAMNTLENAVATIPMKVITLDALIASNNETHLAVDSVKNHYDLLSALQKSIRGSDPDAALYWLTRLSENEDVLEIGRRLLVIAFEDVALGFPGILERTVSAVEAAEKVGFPEAIYPLGYITSELALAPKSRTITNAIAKSRQIIATRGSLAIPERLKLRTIDRNEYYDYNNPTAWNSYTYLPNEIKGIQLFDFAAERRSGKFEQQMHDRYMQLRKDKGYK